METCLKTGLVNRVLACKAASRSVLLVEQFPCEQGMPLLDHV